MKRTAGHIHSAANLDQLTAEIQCNGAAVQVHFTINHNAVLTQHFAALTAVLNGQRCTGIFLGTNQDSGTIDNIFLVQVDLLAVQIQGDGLVQDLDGLLVNHIVHQHQGGAVGPAFQRLNEGIVVHIADSGFRHVGTAVEAVAHGGIKGVVFLLDHGGAGGTGEAVGSVAVVGDLVGVHRVVALDQGQGAVLVLVDPVAQDIGVESCCIQLHVLAGDGEDAVVVGDACCGHVNRPDLTFTGLDIQGNGGSCMEGSPNRLAEEYGTAGNIHRAIYRINEKISATNSGTAGDIHFTEVSQRKIGSLCTVHSTAGNIECTAVIDARHTMTTTHVKSTAGHVHGAVNSDHFRAVIQCNGAADQVHFTINLERYIVVPYLAALTAVLNGQRCIGIFLGTNEDSDTIGIVFIVDVEGLAVQIQGNRLVQDPYGLPVLHIVLQHQGGAAGPAFQRLNEGIVVHIADSGFRKEVVAYRTIARCRIEAVGHIGQLGQTCGAGAGVGGVGNAELVGIDRVVALDQGQGAVLVLVDPVAQNNGLELACIQNHARAGNGKEAVVGFDVGCSHVDRPDLAFAGVGVQSDGLVHIQRTLAAAAEDRAAGNGHRALAGRNRRRAAGDGGISRNLHSGKPRSITDADYASEITTGNDHCTGISNRRRKIFVGKHGAAGHIKHAAHQDHIRLAQFHLAAFQIHRTDDVDFTSRRQTAAANAVLNGQHCASIHYNRCRTAICLQHITVQIQGDGLARNLEHLPDGRIVGLLGDKCIRLLQHQSGAVGPGFQRFRHGVVIHIADTGVRNETMAHHTAAGGRIHPVGFIGHHFSTGRTGAGVSGVGEGELVGIVGVVTLYQRQEAVGVLFNDIAYHSGGKSVRIQPHALAGDSEEAVVCLDLRLVHVHHPDIALGRLGIEYNGRFQAHVAVFLVAIQYRAAGDGHGTLSMPQSLIFAVENGIAGDMNRTLGIVKNTTAIERAAGDIDRTAQVHKDCRRAGDNAAGQVHNAASRNQHQYRSVGADIAAYDIQCAIDLVATTAIVHRALLVLVAVQDGQGAASALFITDHECGVIKTAVIFEVDADPMTIQVQGNRLVHDMDQFVETLHILQQDQGGAVIPGVHRITEGVIVHIADSGVRNETMAHHTVAGDRIYPVGFIGHHFVTGRTGAGVSGVGEGKLVGVAGVITLHQSQSAFGILTNDIAYHSGGKSVRIQLHALAGNGEDAVVGFDVGYNHGNRPDLAFAGVGVQLSCIVQVHRTLVAAGQNGVTGNGQRTAHGSHRHVAADDGGTAGDIHRRIETSAENSGITDHSTTGDIGHTSGNPDSHIVFVISICNHTAAGHIELAFNGNEAIFSTGEHTAAFQIQYTTESYPELPVTDKERTIFAAVSDGHCTTVVDTADIDESIVTGHGQGMSVQIQGHGLVQNHEVLALLCIRHQSQGSAVVPSVQGVSKGFVVDAADHCFRHKVAAGIAVAGGGVEGLMVAAIQLAIIGIAQLADLLIHAVGNAALVGAVRHIRKAEGAVEAVGASVAVVGTLVGVAHVITGHQRQAAVSGLTDHVADDIGGKPVRSQLCIPAGLGEDAAAAGEHPAGHIHSPGLAGLGVQGHCRAILINVTAAAARQDGASGNGQSAAVIDRCVHVPVGTIVHAIDGRRTGNRDHAKVIQAVGAGQGAAGERQLAILLNHNGTAAGRRHAAAGHVHGTADIDRTHHRAAIEVQRANGYKHCGGVSLQNAAFAAVLNGQRAGDGAIVTNFTHTDRLIHGRQIQGVAVQIQGHGLILDQDGSIKGHIVQERQGATIVPILQGLVQLRKIQVVVQHHNHLALAELTDIGLGIHSVEIVIDKVHAGGTGKGMGANAVVSGRIGVAGVVALHQSQKVIVVLTNHVTNIPRYESFGIQIHALAGDGDDAVVVILVHATAAHPPDLTLGRLGVQGNGCHHREGAAHILTEEYGTVKNIYRTQVIIDEAHAAANAGAAGDVHGAMLTAKGALGFPSAIHGTAGKIEGTMVVDKTRKRITACTDRAAGHVHFAVNVDKQETIHNGQCTAEQVHFTINLDHAAAHQFAVLAAVLNGQLAGGIRLGADSELHKHVVLVQIIRIIQRQGMTVEIQGNGLIQDSDGLAVYCIGHQGQGGALGPVLQRLAEGQVVSFPNLGLCHEGFASKAAETRGSIHLMADLLTIPVGANLTQIAHTGGGAAGTCFFRHGNGAAAIIHAGMLPVLLDILNLAGVGRNFLIHRSVGIAHGINFVAVQIAIIDLLSANHGIQILADGLAPDMYILLALEQPGDLTGGELRRSNGGGSVQGILGIGQEIAVFRTAVTRGNMGCKAAAVGIAIVNLTAANIAGEGTNLAPAFSSLDGGIYHGAVSDGGTDITCDTAHIAQTLKVTVRQGQIVNGRITVVGKETNTFLFRPDGAQAGNGVAAAIKGDPLVYAVDGHPVVIPRGNLDVGHQHSLRTAIALIHILAIPEELACVCDLVNGRTPFIVPQVGGLIERALAGGAESILVEGMTLVGNIQICGVGGDAVVRRHVLAFGVNDLHCFRIDIDDIVIIAILTHVQPDTSDFVAFQQALHGVLVLLQGSAVLDLGDDAQGHCGDPITILQDIGAVGAGIEVIVILILAQNIVPGEVQVVDLGVVHAGFCAFQGTGQIDVHRIVYIVVAYLVKVHAAEGDRVGAVVILTDSQAGDLQLTLCDGEGYGRLGTAIDDRNLVFTSIHGQAIQDLAIPCTLHIVIHAVGRIHDTGACNLLIVLLTVIGPAFHGQGQGAIGLTTLGAAMVDGIVLGEIGKFLMAFRHLSTADSTNHQMVVAVGGELIAVRTGTGLDRTGISVPSLCRLVCFHRTFENVDFVNTIHALVLDRRGISRQNGQGIKRTVLSSVKSIITNVLNAGRKRNACKCVVGKCFLFDSVQLAALFKYDFLQILAQGECTQANRTDISGNNDGFQPAAPPKGFFANAGQLRTFLKCNSCQIFASIKCITADHCHTGRNVDRPQLRRNRKGFPRDLRHAGQPQGDAAVVNLGSGQGIANEFQVTRILHRHIQGGDACLQDLTYTSFHLPSICAIGDLDRCGIAVDLPGQRIFFCEYSSRQHAHHHGDGKQHANDSLRHIISSFSKRSI